MKYFFPFLIVICLSGIIPAQEKFVNTSHLDSLYEEITFSGKKVAIIHIYSEAPEYGWKGDEDEGIACVDDVARAAIFYTRHFRKTFERESLRKAKRLMEFLLAMQSENGAFYNFIFEDHSINRTGKTSINRPDWWTWRAMWALSEGYCLMTDRKGRAYDYGTARRYRKALMNSLPLIDSMLSNYPRVMKFQNTYIPEWLPYRHAADQAAVIIMALVPLYEKAKHNTIRNHIKNLADGIIMMQQGDSLRFPHYAHLSWENTWHAWGSNMSEALLKAGDAIDDQRLIQSATREIDNFYNYLLTNGFLSSFKVENFTIVEPQKYPQIAYGFTPMILACMQAYQIYRDEKYVRMAGEISSWFAGNNAVKTRMYDPLNGRGYDGINDEKTMNNNSGAESTIESLLAMLAIEDHPEASEIASKYFSNLR